MPAELWGRQLLSFYWSPISWVWGRYRWGIVYELLERIKHLNHDEHVSPTGSEKRMPSLIVTICCPLLRNNRRVYLNPSSLPFRSGYFLSFQPLLFFCFPFLFLVFSYVPSSVRVIPQAMMDSDISDDIATTTCSLMVVVDRYRYLWYKIASIQILKLYNKS